MQLQLHQLQPRLRSHRSHHYLTLGTLIPRFHHFSWHSNYSHRPLYRPIRPSERVI